MFFVWARRLRMEQGRYWLQGEGLRVYVDVRLRAFG